MADYGYIVSTGVVIPDTATILEEINNEWRAAFGSDIELDPATPQGVIIAADVEYRDGVMRNNAALANQINPDIAGGVYLDAIWRLTRGQRRGATRSTIPGVILGGQDGTLVPAGSAAEVEGTRAVFVTAAAVIIGASTPGVAVVDMVARDFGPIGAPVGQLINVATSVLGWETVTNPNAATVGRLVESDAESRRRRRNTLGLQSTGLAEAVTSALYELPTVRSLKFRENWESTTQVIDGITLKPHSLWVCVDGGTDLEVASTLLTVKGGGCGYNGLVSITITEPTSGQPCPVLFDRPLQVIVYARVTAKYNNTDGATIIPDAIMSYANGELEGEDGFVVGASVSPFELSGAVNQVEPRILVKKVEVSTDGVTWSSDDLVLPINQQAVITSSRVIVVPV